MSWDKDAEAAESARLAKLTPQALVAEYEFLAGNWSADEWWKLQLTRREVVRRMQVGGAQ